MNNVEAIEPNEYFKTLKGKVYKINKEMLNANLSTIENAILAANAVGQDELVNKLAFSREIIQKEQILLSSGVEAYCEKEDIKYLIEKITPENSVKIIELERYPRIIPDENINHIQSAKELNVFDVFLCRFYRFHE